MSDNLRTEIASAMRDRLSCMDGCANEHAEVAADALATFVTDLRERLVMAIEALTTVYTSDEYEEEGSQLRGEYLGLLAAARIVRECP